MRYVVAFVTGFAWGYFWTGYASKHRLPVVTAVFVWAVGLVTLVSLISVVFS